MIFPNDLILENDRVRLRPLQTEDLNVLLPFAIGEPELWTYSAVSAAGTDGMKKYILDAVWLREQKKEYPFIVFDKITQQYAGSTRFYDIQLPFSTVQLGYTWYGKVFQRSGLNRHCKWLLLNYAFEHWGMERVEFRADNRNERSILAMKNIGCRIEGVLRSNMPLASGGRRDSIVLSILKTEWPEVKALLLDKMH
jgi:N-acetyltransferase